MTWETVTLIIGLAATICGTSAGLILKLYGKDKGDEKKNNEEINAMAQLEKRVSVLESQQMNLDCRLDEFRELLTEHSKNSQEGLQRMDKKIDSIMLMIVEIHKEKGRGQ